MNKQQLCDSFPSSSVTFTEVENGLIVVRVDNEFASTQVLLQGAQVLSYVPHGKPDLLWISDDACYEKGRPVRGGVPICWPWFGASSEQPMAPAHGFARNLMWVLEEVTDLNDGATELLFTLESSDESRRLWPYLFTLQYRVVVGPRLELNLTTSNVDSQQWSFTEALHSYLAVQSIERARLSGFFGLDYQDKLSSSSDLQQQGGDLVVAGEVDRIYHTGQRQDDLRGCELSDPASGQTISVAASGSSAVVVWNPWVVKAEALADFANEGYRTMLCIEAANTEPSPVNLKPGESHTLCQVISLL